MFHCIHDDDNDNDINDNDNDNDESDGNVVKRPCKFELNSIELAGLDRRDASLWSSYRASDITNKDNDNDNDNDNDSNLVDLGGNLVNS